MNELNVNKQEYRFTSKDGIPSAILGMIVGFFGAIILANIGLENLPGLLFLIGNRFPNAFLISFLIIVPILAVFALWITYLIGKKLPFVYQFGRFANVGFANFFIDAGVFNLLIFFSKGEVPDQPLFSIFKAFTFLLALANSFFWNKFWTFKAKEKITAPEFLQFAIVTLLSLGLNIAVAGFIKSLIISGFNPKLWANLAVVSGAASSFIFNFLGYKFIVFKK